MSDLYERLLIEKDLEISSDRIAIMRDPIQAWNRHPVQIEKEKWVVSSPDFAARECELIQAAKAIHAAT